MNRRGICPHRVARYFGTDATAHFYRCADCGEVFVRQGDAVWRVRPAPSTA